VSVGVREKKRGRRRRTREVEEEREVRGPSGNVSRATLHKRGEMSLKWAEMLEAMDAWKFANPEAVHGRTVKNFCPPDAEGMDAGRVMALALMAEVQAEGGAKTEAKQTEAVGVLLELLAVYCETQVMEETCVARKLDGNLCGVNVGKKHKGSAGDCSPNLQVCGRPQ
jgi:hypothetical protein